MHIVLDSEVLGMVSNPHPQKQQTIDCNRWLEMALLAGHTVCLPEIIDYEQRRVFLHQNWKESIDKLDALKQYLEFLPITTDVMLLAARFWADARKNDPHAPQKPQNQRLDIDMILAAQARVNISYAHKVIIATANLKDIQPFADAREWRTISIG
jgi:predicted nucleic acid-binding protein